VIDGDAVLAIDDAGQAPPGGTDGPGFDVGATGDGEGVRREVEVGVQRMSSSSTPRASAISHGAHPQDACNDSIMVTSRSCGRMPKPSSFITAGTG